MSTLSHSLIGEQETGSFLSHSADTACKASLTEQVQAAHLAMVSALVEYHTHGDFLAAASYTTAKAEWEQAVLNAIKG